MNQKTATEPTATEPTATVPTAIAETKTPTFSNWTDLADQILSGHQLSEAEGLSVLNSPDDELLDVMAAAYRVRRAYFKNSVQFYFLMNAKSGLCPEDCSYCSQSKISEAEIPKYNILNREKLLDGARIAAEQDAKTYCIVISARGPSEYEMSAVERIVPEIKEHFDLKICACLGLLDEDQASRLKACGVDRVNHNVNTSEEHYEKICSTHTYADRVNTLNAVRDAGLEICSGGIIGMGEQPIDVVRMALELRDIGARSIPLNFLIPIDGTPLGQTGSLTPGSLTPGSLTPGSLTPGSLTPGSLTPGSLTPGSLTPGSLTPGSLTPRDCLRALAMFRFANPDRELRIAGGRELHLGSLQPLGLYAANSIFIGDYLTTRGQLPEDDVRMVQEMGFEVTKHEEVIHGNAT